MKYALIENGKVKEIVNKKFPFAENKDIFFKSFDETKTSVKEGYFFKNNEFKETDLSDKDFLEQKKSIKRKEIKTDRDIFIYTPIEYLGTKFINSEVSGNNLQATYSFIDEPIEWLDIDGVLVTLTKNQLKGLIGLIMQQRSKGYFLEAEFKKKINDCSTVKEVDNLILNFKIR